LFQQVGMLDSLPALVVTYVATNIPIVVWLMRDYFAALPKELEESASVDGASIFRIVRSIVLPVSVPGLVAAFLIVLIFSWNEFLIALVLTSADAQTMPLQVAAQNATRGPQWWAMSVLILIMIAPVVVMAILLERYITRGLLDNILALVITYVAANLPIVVWLMRDYFAKLPWELEEAAVVDGASAFRVFRSITLPLSAPGLVATFLIVLVFAWNEYLLALFLSSADAQTMPLTVAAQNATRGPQWWYMSVLIQIMILPVIALAVALERVVSRGLLVGAVKG
ncbi:MAG: carbohydrate ABC transporter permease, partial [Actinomycetes bacterium]